VILYRFSCHICWFSSFSVLALRNARLSSKHDVPEIHMKLVIYHWFCWDFISYLLIFEFQCFGSEECKTLLETWCTRNSYETCHISLILLRFYIIFADFRVSVFWQKYEQLCGILYTFCSKIIWDSSKKIEAPRNPRFSSKHDLLEINMKCVNCH